MPYARFDDRWDDHRKIKRALRREPAVVAMHAMAITYSNRHNSDGHVDSDWVEEKLALMPYKPAQCKRVLELLLELRLFEELDEETYLVHDFLDWNLSREQRAQLAEQGRRGGRSGSKGSSDPDGGGSSVGQSDGLSEGSSEPLSTPRHATPTPSQGKTTRASDPAVSRLCQRLAERVGANDPKASPHPESERWQTDMRLLLADRGGDEAEVERIIDWSQADAFWQSNILSPAKLRKQFTQLVLKAGNGNVVSINPAIPEHLRATPEHDAQIRAFLAQKEGA